jgi:hypothetical protein
MGQGLTPLQRHLRIQLRAADGRLDRMRLLLLLLEAADDKYVVV